jgi:mRNA interferase MazF
MKRYESHWARLDPVLGSEIGKTRPCVIISDERYNAALPTVVVCPLSSTVRPRWRSRVQITCAGKAADVCVEQIRTISQQRLAGRLGSLSAVESAAVRRIITEMYGQP